MGDSRNQLFREYKRLLDGLAPKAFVMENVPAMAFGDMRGTFNDIFSALSEGYVVRARIMNSADFGVPQNRHRMIFIGIRKDLGIAPTFPEKSGKRRVNVREAFKDVLVDAEVVHPVGKIAAISWRMRQGQCAKDFHPRKSYYNLRRLSWARPSWTVTKTFTPYDSGLIHPTENRFVTISELKRLCSFPDDFKMAGTFEEKWARLGNAVMPRFMEAVACHVKAHILQHE